MAVLDNFGKWSNYGEIARIGGREFLRRGVQPRPVWGYHWLEEENQNLPFLRQSWGVNQAVKCKCSLTRNFTAANYLGALQEWVHRRDSMTWIKSKAGIENSGSKRNSRQWSSLGIAKRFLSLKSRSDWFLLSSTEEKLSQWRLPLASMHGRRCVITVRSFGAQPIETSLLGTGKGWESILQSPVWVPWSHVWPKA